MLLKHEDNTKLRLLAAKANQLVAFGGHKNTVANRRGDVTERPHRCYPGEGQAAEKRQAEQEAATATTAAAPEGEVPHRPGYPEQGLSRTLLPGADTGGRRGWQSHPPPPQARQCISGSMSEFMSEFMSKFMSKFTTQPSAPNLPIPVPSGRFKHIHVDLVGPLMASDEGYTHVMTMVNRTTRWMEVIPLS